APRQTASPAPARRAAPAPARRAEPHRLPPDTTDGAGDRRRGVTSDRSDPGTVRGSAAAGPGSVLPSCPMAATGRASVTADQAIADRVAAPSRHEPLPPDRLVDAAAVAGVQDTPPGNAGVALAARVRGLRPERKSVV